MIKMIAELIFGLFEYTIIAGCVLMLIACFAEIFGLTTLYFMFSAVAIGLLMVGFFAMVVHMFIWYK